MAFQKGTSGNANGRPKGAKGKLPANVREFIKDVIDKNRAKINADLKNLEPKERLDIIVKLLAFVVPKPQSIVLQDMTPDGAARLADIDNAPADVRDGYFNYLDWVTSAAANASEQTDDEQQ